MANLARFVEKVTAYAGDIKESKRLVDRQKFMLKSSPNKIVLVEDFFKSVAVPASQGSNHNVFSSIFEKNGSKIERKLKELCSLGEMPLFAVSFASLHKDKRDVVELEIAEAAQKAAQKMAESQEQATRSILEALRGEEIASKTVVTVLASDTEKQAKSFEEQIKKEYMLPAFSLKDIFKAMDECSVFVYVPGRIEYETVSYAVGEGKNLVEFWTNVHDLDDYAPPSSGGGGNSRRKYQDSTVGGLKPIFI